MNDSNPAGILAIIILLSVAVVGAVVAFANAATINELERRVTVLEQHK